MQDQNQTNPTPVVTPPLLSDDAVIQPDTPDTPDTPDLPEPSIDATTSTDIAGSEPSTIMRDVSEKIKNVHNILIALSSDPSVDEIATAIALSLCLDRAGKRATAIYSGTTPNALQFLNPERTFETNSNVLKDFVIALSKDKADHLRYKLDGDYVKIFITPYKNSISESDLEFSLGDFNIELVLALNVPSGIDLDDALREHGRVMHDATVINITNGNPGKFGDIEWSDKSRSSIAEMVADLLYNANGENGIEPEEATALLTGIVSATDHFTNNMTTANALQIAADLIRSGADRKLVNENINLGSENMFFSNPKQDKNDDGSIKINHDEPQEATASRTIDAPNEDKTPSEGPVAEPTTTEPTPAEPIIEAPTFVQSPASEPAAATEDSSLLADLQAAADGLKSAAEIVEPVPDPSEQKQELTLTPSEDFMNEPADSGSNYGQMLEDALADAYAIPTANPAINAAPSVPTAPEINGVPDINYVPVPNDDILPPPPTPPIDPSMAMPNIMPPTSPDTTITPPATF